MRTGKPIKNKKRRDPRYFLHEDQEEQLAGEDEDVLGDDEGEGEDPSEMTASVNAPPEGEGEE